MTLGYQLEFYFWGVACLSRNSYVALKRNAGFFKGRTRPNNNVCFLRSVSRRENQLHIQRGLVWGLAYEKKSKVVIYWKGNIQTAWTCKSCNFVLTFEPNFSKRVPSQNWGRIAVLHYSTVVSSRRSSCSLEEGVDFRQEITSFFWNSLVETYSTRNYGRDREINEIGFHSHSGDSVFLDSYHDMYCVVPRKVGRAGETRAWKLCNYCPMWKM